MEKNTDEVYLNQLNELLAFVKDKKVNLLI
jgi:hypothetical protein